MPFLLIDERDGRVIAELRTEEDLQRILEAWARVGEHVPGYLSIVRLESHPGTIVGTDSSVTIRPL